MGMLDRYIKQNGEAKPPAAAQADEWDDGDEKVIDLPQKSVDNGERRQVNAEIVVKHILDLGTRANVKTVIRKDDSSVLEFRWVDGHHVGHRYIVKFADVIHIRVQY